MKIHKTCLSGAEIEQSFTANKPAAPPALVARRLPSGPETSGKFGAFYTPLKFCEEWDAQWRGDGPDVVVAFDQAPFRMVCWRGASYAPCFVTEKGNWMSNEFVERGAATGTVCRGTRQPRVLERSRMNFHTKPRRNFAHHKILRVPVSSLWPL